VGGDASIFEQVSFQIIDSEGDLFGQGVTRSEPQGVPTPSIEADRFGVGHYQRFIVQAQRLIGSVLKSMLKHRCGKSRLPAAGVGGDDKDIILRPDDAGMNRKVGGSRYRRAIQFGQSPQNYHVLVIVRGDIVAIAIERQLVIFGSQ
jgi:hypothetical protein